MPIDLPPGFWSREPTVQDDPAVVYIADCITPRHASAYVRDLDGTVDTAYLRADLVKPALELIDTELQWLEYDGCMTGDCPHYNPNECVEAMQKALAETAERCRAALLDFGWSGSEKATEADDA